MTELIFSAVTIGTFASMYAAIHFLDRHLNKKEH